EEVSRRAHAPKRGKNVLRDRKEGEREEQEEEREGERPVERHGSFARVYPTGGGPPEGGDAAGDQHAGERTVERLGPTERSAELPEEGPRPDRQPVLEEEDEREGLVPTAEPVAPPCGEPPGRDRRERDHAEVSPRAEVGVGDVVEQPWRV